MSALFCDIHPDNPILFYCESCHKVGCYKCQDSDMHKMSGLAKIKDQAEQARVDIENLQERITYKLQKINDQGQQLIKTLQYMVGFLSDFVQNFDKKNQTQLLGGAKFSHPKRIQHMMEYDYSQKQRKAQFIDHKEFLHVQLNKYAQQLKNNDFAGAMRILETIIFLDNHNYIYEKEMERLKVLQAEKQTITQQRQSVRPEINVEAIDSRQAITLFKQEKYDEALKAFQKIIDYDGSQYQIQYQAGFCLYMMQKYVESLEYFELSLGLKLEGNLDALFGKCQSLYELKFQPALENSYHMMKLLYKDDMKTLLVWGQLLLLTKKYEQALKCFETLLSANQNYYDALFYKLKTLIKLGRDLDEANNYIFILTEAQYDRRKIQEIKNELENIL